MVPAAPCQVTSANVNRHRALAHADGTPGPSLGPSPSGLEGAYVQAAWGMNKLMHTA